MEIFDDRICALGEGPLWHPEREQLFWFDILGKRLLSRAGDTPLAWQFDEHVSAAGWVDRDRLLICSETGLFLLDLDTAARTPVAALEAETPANRSNDGRADPFGGFWIGTMAKAQDPGAGAIYRYHRGVLRKLFRGLTIPNSICFSPDGAWACFCDTPERRILRVALDGAGWPRGEAETFIDLRAGALNPDGMVIDSRGWLWNAQWGSGRIATYDRHGRFREAHRVPARQPSCPAFGGAELSTVFVTTAAEGVAGTEEGRTFAMSTNCKGQREHRVIL